MRRCERSALGALCVIAAYHIALVWQAPLLALLLLIVVYLYLIMKGGE